MKYEEFVYAYGKCTNAAKASDVQVLLNLLTDHYNLGLKEIASKLSVAYCTIRRWHRKAQLPTIKNYYKLDTLYRETVITRLQKL